LTVPPAGELRGRLEAHVRALAEGIGPRHLGSPRALAEAAAYVAEAAGRSALAVASQGFEAAGCPVRNLDIELGNGDGPTVVVAAHYDTVPGSPGADDNASGVAAVLEIARLLARAPPAARIRCAFFVNEEPPWFQTEAMGSLRYARRARERGEAVAAMLSLESIGYYVDGPRTQGYPFPLGLAYPDTGNFLGIVSDRRCRGLMRRVESSFRRHTSFPVVAAALPAWVPGVSWSDHWAFWQAGFPAVMLTDTAPFRYPAYHTEEDTPGRLDYDRLATVVAALAAVVLELAGDPGRPAGTS
jgi:Zn-dependent M28 family amino/carboxypeptidase